MKEFCFVKKYLAVIISVALLVIATGIIVVSSLLPGKVVTVGFIYDNDETTPYSYSFYLAQEALSAEYGDRIRTLLYSNVLEQEIGTPVEKFAEEGCDIIFTNCYGNIRSLAKKYPSIQFCQVSNDPYPEEEASHNYHTFKGEIYEGRYASGVVAGLKLKDMIENRVIFPNQAKVGFVAAFPYPEVISGYTAFLLGVRSVVPQATMLVKYTNIWSNFTLEKACAEELMEEGCFIISQHCDTVGPAVACEENYAMEAYHVGYNIDMTDVAPSTSLTSARINWTPYILGAVKAVMEHKQIEDVVEGTVHPLQDMSAGFDKDWVQLTAINEALMPEGTLEKVDEVIEALKNNECKVFYGNYYGVNPADEKDTVDLNTEFIENENSSIPAFRYVLRDIITVVD